MDHQVTSHMCSSPVLDANKMQLHVLQEAAGQLRRSPHEFAGIEALSPLLWLARGYAIMDGPGFPIVAEGGDDAEPNDTYVEQLTAAARAAVQVPTAPSCEGCRYLLCQGRMLAAAGLCHMRTHAGARASVSAVGDVRRFRVKRHLAVMQELDRRGVVDTARIAVGGHSCAGRCCAGSMPCCRALI